jgi:hypothetical protein
VALSRSSHTIGVRDYGGERGSELRMQRSRRVSRRLQVRMRSSLPARGLECFSIPGIEYIPQIGFARGALDDSEEDAAADGSPRTTSTTRRSTSVPRRPAPADVELALLPPSRGRPKPPDDPVPRAVADDVVAQGHPAFPHKVTAVRLVHDVCPANVILDVHVVAGRAVVGHADDEAANPWSAVARSQAI